MTTGKIKGKQLLKSTGNLAKRNVMVCIAVALLIICSATSPKFLTLSNILSIFRQNTIVGVLAVGECIAIIAGGIDASVASIMCAGVMVLGKVQDYPFAVCCLIVLAFCFAVGTISGVAVAYFNVVPFIATLATSLIADGIALLINYGKPLYWTNNHQDFIKVMGMGSLPLNYCTEQADGSIRIGATATLSALQYGCLAGKPPFHALLEAAAHIGSLQIRNMATLAGNICTGITSADAIAALIALDAEICVIGREGKRRLPASDFVVANRKLALKHDELVYEIFLPPQKEGTESYFRKVGTRKELFISVVNIAVLINTNASGVVEKCRIAMGVMAYKTLRLQATERELEGNCLTTEVIDAAIRTMKTEVSPRTSRHGSSEYRSLVAENLLRDFLLTYSERRSKI